MKNGLGIHRDHEHIQQLAAELRPILEVSAKVGRTLTYREAAQALGLKSPHTIRRTATALEALMAADAAAGRPFLAALVVSRDPGRNGLPTQGFFECAAEFGRCQEQPSRKEAAQYHKVEVQAVFDYYAADG